MRSQRFRHNLATEHTDSCRLCWVGQKSLFGFSESCYEKNPSEKKKSQHKKTFRFLSTVTQGTFVSWKTHAVAWLASWKTSQGDGLRPNIRKSRIKTHRLVQRQWHNLYDALTEASQRKTSHMILLICGIQRNSTKGPMQNRSWATDIENKLWLPEGEQAAEV